MSGYLSGIDLKADFIKAESQFKFMGLSTQNHNNMRNLETTIANQQQQIISLQTTIKAMNKKIENVESMLIEYQLVLAEKLGLKVIET